MSFDISGWVDANLVGRETSTGQFQADECPWCGGGKFYLAFKGKRAGKYICFQCDERGSNLSGLIAQVEGISRHEAVRRMLREANVFRRREQTPRDLLESIVSLRGREIEGQDDVDFDLPREMVHVFRKDRAKQWLVPKYLVDRGVTKETARAWGMGYCPRGRYAGRLIIPIQCPNGRSWTARDMTGKQKPKYLNPSGADHSRLLIGWQHVRVSADAGIVEGPLDSVKAWQAGVPSYGLGGKVMSPDQLSMLSAKPRDCSITVALDPEEIRAPYAVAKQLVVHFARVYVAKITPGFDPGSEDPDRLVDIFRSAKRFSGSGGDCLVAMLGAAGKKMSEFPK